MERLSPSKSLLFGIFGVIHAAFVPVPFVFSYFMKPLVKRLYTAMSYFRQDPSSTSGSRACGPGPPRSCLTHLHAVRGTARKRDRGCGRDDGRACTREGGRRGSESAAHALSALAFGHALGEPGNVAQQRTILHDMLSMARAASRPGLVIELPYRWRRETYPPIVDWTADSVAAVSVAPDEGLFRE